MPKVGRNATCPCGSGKKYKRCCLNKHEVERAASAPSASVSTPTPLASVIIADDDDLDELSNRAVDLIQAGKLDDAETVARELTDRYPQVPDGLERLAAVHEARGNFADAADHYRQAADLIQNDPGYESEPFYREQAARLEDKARS